MLFGLIRIALMAAMFCICFVLIQRSRTMHKRRYLIIAFVATAMIITASVLIPPEKAFVSFSSPEAAYSYNHTGKAEIITDGELSSFVVASKGDTYEYAIIPKSGGRWKIGTGFDVKTAYNTLSDGVSVYIYRCGGTDDCFITATDTNGGWSEVSDDRGSEFQYLKKTDDVLNKSFYTYYAYVNGFDGGYTLTVGEKTIELMK